jgi:hypothetical protein
VSGFPLMMQITCGVQVQEEDNTDANAGLSLLPMYIMHAMPRMTCGFIIVCQTGELSIHHENFFRCSDMWSSSIHAVSGPMTSIRQIDLCQSSA